MTDSANRFSPESILFGSNISYILALYRQYQKDPNSVSIEWRAFFKDFSEEDFEETRFSGLPHFARNDGTPTSSPGPKGRGDPETLIAQAYRTFGHLAADLDPLGIVKPQGHPELDPAFYGLQDADINDLRETYCGKVGAEFMHIENGEERLWLQERLESPKKQEVFPAKDLLRWVLQGELFEKFLHVKFPGTKRFGIEGNESLLVALEIILQKTAQTGTDEVVIGMSHRGRLSVMTQFMKKPMRHIFAQFRGTEIDRHENSGDVKYHLGYSSDRTIQNHTVHLCMLSNPSHLESIYPVALGTVRGRKNGKTLGLILHGDASFTGQGITAEALQLSTIPGYTVGGTIHIIVNNQIGFTASPSELRSSRYSSDPAKIIQAPIFHVNADDPEALAHVVDLVTDYHAKFQKDVVIDLIGYRRHGHNEGDEPTFTQPLMYQAIENHPTVGTLYQQTLLQKGLLSPQNIQEIRIEVEDDLHKEFEAPYEQIPEAEKLGTKNFNPVPGVEIALLKKWGQLTVNVPEGFHLHPKIERQFKQRQTILQEQGDIDWTTAETLAFASLLEDGFPIRLSGQDSVRGTFSQRHGIVIDQTTGTPYTPLNNLPSTGAKIELLNSSLSEAAVLGFEYGYSLSNPNALVLWEAQFGDFANGAQVIIDQYISAAKAKWNQTSGLVILLPHGLEGQGPEHSSARLERFLQLSAENNWFVANCSTPANYFHILRRQLKSEHRLPLILMTPKSLLRHKLAVSPLDDLGPQSSFQEVVPDRIAPPDLAKRVILCSGKIYYDLLQRRLDTNNQEIALVRLEQFYPFPKEMLKTILEPYQKAEIIWCQEEPENMGGWSFVRPYLEDILKGLGRQGPLYRGRPKASSPATGSHECHQAEQAALVDEAIGKL